jgi:hypothetical protein
VLLYHWDARLAAAVGHRLGDSGVGVIGKIDPFRAALSDRLAGLLDANDLVLRCKLRDHGDSPPETYGKFARKLTLETAGAISAQTV